MDIQVKRVYDAAAAGDGWRVLVDRVWPRGLGKAQVRADAWLKDVAPSTALRKWFAHDRAKWDAFVQRYAAELDANPEALEPLRIAAKRGRLTLLYGARDNECNQAVALRAYLHAHGRQGVARRHSGSSIEAG